MEKNKRREEILSEIPACQLVCDVGCDHGYIGAECLARGITGRVIFSDVSAPSLAKAKSLIAGSDLECRAEFVCTNGLSGLEFEDSTATVVICGMGGEEILKIISERLPKTLLLQPMSEVEKLRFELARNYKIIKDRLFFDRGKYYNLILAEKCEGGDVLSGFEVMFGKTNLAMPSGDFLEYAKARRDRQISIKQKRKTADKKDDEVIGFLNEFIEKTERENYENK